MRGTTQKGAGGFFGGIDALPLTGQYTTYALSKDGKPNYVTDSAASGTGMVHRHQDLQRRARHRHQGRAAEDDPRTRQGPGLRHRRHHHLRDPGRHARSAVLPHHRAGAATGPRRLPRTARTKRWRTADQGRSPNSCLPTGRTSRWVAAPRRSHRPRPPATTRTRRSRRRPRNAASKSSAPQTN